MSTTPDLAGLLREVVREAVREALAQHAAADSAVAGGRLAYPEAEAAALLGVQRHTLRDCRLRGEIAARRVGKRWVYSRDTLVRWLASGEAAR
jgi:excisionase family DNA binding protein